MWRFRGLTALSTLIVIAGFIIAGTMIISQIANVSVINKLVTVFGGTNVQITILPIDEGTRITTLLRGERDGVVYSELLGVAGVEGFPGDTTPLEETLDILDFTVGVKDRGKTVFQVRGGEANVIRVDLPLPGLRKGVMEVGVE